MLVLYWLQNSPNMARLIYMALALIGCPRGLSKKWTESER